MFNGGIEILETIVSFFETQLVFSLILFVIIYSVSNLFKIKSHFILLGLWTLIFIRLILPTDLAHPLSGRMLVNALLSDEEVLHGEINYIEHKNKNYLAEEVNLDQLAVQSGSNYLPYILISVWFLGFSLLLSYYFKRNNKYRKIITSSKICNDKFLFEILAQWKSEFSIRRNIVLVSGDSFTLPFTTGILKPIIFLPSFCIKNADKNTIESIIAHETAHIKNYDDFWIRLQSFIQIIYFFNPIVWLAGNKLSQVREQYCDSLVISKRKISKKNYGYSLINIINKNYKDNSFELFSITAFSNKKERITERILNIKNSKIFKRKHYVYSLLLISFFAFLVLPMGNYSKDHNHDNINLLLTTPVLRGNISLGYGVDNREGVNLPYHHNGVDISCNGGESEVIASADGIICKVGKDNLFDKNLALRINHDDGLSTRYLHLDSIYVKENSFVKRGDKIGHTSICVHFEVYKEGKEVNPSLFLDMNKDPK